MADQSSGPIVVGVDGSETALRAAEVAAGLAEELGTSLHVVSAYEHEGRHEVVGVGSVGTRCFIVLLKGKDDDDPLFLQIKEAGLSVLEAHLPRSTYNHHGERVVAGQKLMQAASDSFLGWTYNPASGHHFYWRQLKDMKASLEIEGESPSSLQRFANLTGWTLARAHARSGDAGAIAGYLGSGEVFDEAIACVAVAEN